MAKKSSIEKNNRRQKMAKNAAPKRAKLKAIIADKTNRTVVKVVQTMATAVFLPVAGLK